MSGSTREPKHLPPGLTATVGEVGEILGDVVADVEGEALYGAVESVRREMVAFREADGGAGREEALDRAARRLAALAEIALRAIPLERVLSTTFRQDLSHPATFSHELRASLAACSQLRASLTHARDRAPRADSNSKSAR
jgi:hypothetical protein